MRTASRKRVVRLMRADALRRLLRERFERTIMSEHEQQIAFNVLDREFTAEPKRWGSDTREFVIAGSAKLYLVAILDLASRSIPGEGHLSTIHRSEECRHITSGFRGRNPIPEWLAQWRWLS